MIVPAGRYVVLGASGLLGSHALAALADRPDVTVVAVRHSRPLAVQADNIIDTVLDLDDRDGCRRVMEGADYLLHFAGILASAPVLAADPLGPVLGNLRIAVNGLEAAYRAGVKHCVWLSSTTGYPNVDGQLDEDRMFEGQPPESWKGIGWVIRYAETLCRDMAERLPNALAVTVLRPTMVYGEHAHFSEEVAHFLPAMIRRVVNRENPIEVWGDGKATRDLIHAADVVGAALASLSRQSGFAAYNVAAGESYSVNEVLRLIIELDDFKDAVIKHVTGRPESVSHRSFSSARIEQELGFKPGISLPEGLRRTISWYRSHR